MDELARLMDWDLQAIVKGCTSETPATAITDNLRLNYSHFHSEQDDMFFNFPEFSETTAVVDELEELYKPFYPVLNNPISIVTSSQTTPEETEEVKVLKLKPSDHEVASKDSKDPAASKCKRSKKNQTKRVKQVKEAEGFSDGWAWRKYGQKPIKGSPYPRSYYRCSSSKGCLARKQVERSHLDPKVFIVTYTAEHSHSHPTRNKNSQAGSTRTNISAIASPRTMGSVEDGNAPSVEKSKSLEKEDDLVESMEDEEGGNRFPSIKLEEELNGLDKELALDECGFMDNFAETWFNSSIYKPNVMNCSSSL